MMNMRFDGTDTSVMVSQGGEDAEVGMEEGFGNKFKKMYKDQFGFLLEGKDIIVDDIKVRIPRGATCIVT